MVSRFQARVVEHTYGGIGLRISLEDPLGEAWYDRDLSEPLEIRVLRERDLLTGGRIFDLGAHQCVVALLLAHHAGERGHVIAVEAEPHNVAVSSRNLALNRTKNITVVGAVVTERFGQAPFTFWEQARSVSATVDSLAREYGHPNVVLMDIEGYEARALAGAAETLTRGATFVIELHVGCGLEDAGGTIEQVIDPLSAAGYQLWITTADDDSGDWRPVDETPIARSFIFAIPPRMHKNTSLKSQVD